MAGEAQSDTTIRASVVMTYMADLQKSDMKRAQQLFAAVQKTVAATGGTKYTPWSQPWKTPVRLSGLDWPTLLPAKQDLFRKRSNGAGP
jgi:hypothetical protein